ncbi:MAG: FG-GAP repeat domain-containing protein, partial [Gemmataceae bacterium]
GKSPASVAMGDLNGDAFLDFVVANSGSDNISIFLGNGNGTFAPQINYNSQFGPAFVKLANINGPNAFMADILIADLTSNDVRILLNSEPIASNLSFITNASGASSGTAFTIQPVLSVLDAFGNSIPGYTDQVTMTVSAGATVVGTATVNPVAGVATFTNVGISGLAGTQYTLTFSSGSLVPATQVIIPTVGAPTQLVLSVNAAGGSNRSGFNTQPGNVTTFIDYSFPGSTNGESFTTQPVVLIKDSGGNTVTTSNALVTLSVSSGATLTGNTVVGAIAGKATFTNVGVNGVQGTQYTLTYSSPGLASVTQAIGNGINGTGSGGIGGPTSRINSSSIFAVGPGSSPNSYSTPTVK